MSVTADEYQKTSEIDSVQRPIVVDDSVLNTAWDLFEQSNYPQSEIYCRQALENNPDSSDAAKLMSHLKHAYEIPDGFELSETVPVEDSGERFLIIKAWGYGFWSEGHHLAGQLLLAELTHRTPIVLWGTNCIFRSPADVNSSSRFFKEISPARIEDIPENASIYPPKWTHDTLLKEDVSKWEGEYSRLAAQYLLARRETVVVCDFFSTINSIMPWISESSDYFGKTEDELYSLMFQKYLVPSDELTEKVNNFCAYHMQGRPWVAVHMRGSDKVYESPHLANTNAQYYAYIDRIISINPSIGVFLMTDTLSMVATFQQRYGDRLLCTDAIRTANDVGVHLGGNDGVKIGEEVLIDSMIAAKCDYLIGNMESNVSHAITSMRDWTDGFVFLLGLQSCRHVNMFLHRRIDRTGAVCRLCGGVLAPSFTRTILSKYSVQYFKCCSCSSLQTEKPYWRDEAQEQHLVTCDTGKASRTIRNFLILPQLLEIMNVKLNDCSVDMSIDTGLFARLMRDAGYNYYSVDPLGYKGFNSGFSWDQFNRSVKLITLFEEATHFVDPSSEWDRLFGSTADFILGSTSLYEGQGSDWINLSDSGMQTFFYSKSAISHIANRHGWSAYILGNYFLFARNSLSAKAGSELITWSANLDTIQEENMKRWLKDTYSYATEDNSHLTILANLRKESIKIAVDGYFFRFSTGISRLCKSLLTQWSANGFGEYVVVLDRDRTAPRFAGITYLDIPQHDYGNLPADRQLLQDVCDREGISLFISTYYTTPLSTPAVQMIYDMIPEVMNFDLNNLQWQEKHTALRYCKNFLSISHSTCNDLIRFFPEISKDQVTTAYCGSDFRTPSEEQVVSFKERYKIERPYFLISGVKSDYKNALLFFKAFAQLGDDRQNYSIVCTNSMPTLEPEYAECLGEGTTHLLILSYEDLQSAYAGAIALVYPSRYEGFGLPVLEAMACSCPVITCNNSSIGEVGGTAVIYIDPDDQSEMYEQILYVQDETVRGELIKKGIEQASKFSWRKMASTVEKELTRIAFLHKNNTL